MAAVNLSDALTARATAQAQETFGGSLDALTETAVDFYLQIQFAVRRVSSANLVQVEPTSEQVVTAAGALLKAGHITAAELDAIKSDPGAVSKPQDHPVIKAATKAHIKETIAAAKVTLAAGALTAADSPAPDPRTNIGANLGAIQAAAIPDPVEAAAQAIAASNIGTDEVVAFLSKIERVGTRVAQLRG
jgi:hypothetical protein